MQDDVLSSTQRRGIAGALYDLGNGAYRVLRITHTRLPGPQSPLAKLLANSSPVEVWGQARPLEDAVRKGVLKPIIAGFDHFDAYATGLRSDRSLTMSLATIARGALEAWGRAWWVQQAASATELQCRRHSLTLSELKYQVMLDPGGLFSYPDPQGIQRAITAIEYQDKVRTLLAQLDPGFAPKAPSYTQLTTDFLLLIENENARDIYSRLSAVAHGETIGTAAFTREVEHDPNAEIEYHPSLIRYKYGLSKELGLGYANVLARAITLVTRSSLDWWGMSSNDADQWEQNRWRACERLDEIGRA